MSNDEDKMCEQSVQGSKLSMIKLMIKDISKYAIRGPRFASVRTSKQKLINNPEVDGLANAVKLSLSFKNISLSIFSQR